MKIIIIDYFNFFYDRYYNLEENIIDQNLYLLNHFANHHNIKTKIFFDGQHWSKLNEDNDLFTLYFSPNGSSADEEIVKQFWNLQGQHNYLVSNDLQLQKTLQKTSSILPLKPKILWQKLDRHLDKYMEIIISKNKKNFKKLKKTTEWQDSSLDELYKNL